MRPIEKGCLAISYGCLIPENNGKVVTVGKFLGIVLDFGIQDRWEVDKAFKSQTAIGNVACEDVYHLPEKSLMRIDGGEYEEGEEQQEELTNEY